jgi:hypothetical protein
MHSLTCKSRTEEHSSLRSSPTTTTDDEMYLCPWSAEVFEYRIQSVCALFCSTRHASALHLNRDAELASAAFVVIV